MKKIIAFSIAFVPISFVSATSHAVLNITNFSLAVSSIKNLLNLVISLFVALAIFYFIWGVFDFVRSAGAEEARKVGRDRMIYGIIGIAIMLSVLGLVNFLVGSTEVTTTPLVIPTIPLTVN